MYDGEDKQPEEKMTDGQVPGAEAAGDADQLEETQDDDQPEEVEDRCDESSPEDTAGV